MTARAELLTGFAVVMLAAGCSAAEKALPADYHAVPVTERTDYTSPTPRPQTGILRSTALSKVKERACISRTSRSNPLFRR